MRCIQIDNPGPQSHLVINERPLPLCQRDEILIKVKATAINRADLLQRQGKYSPPQGESDILGLEVAGDVVQIGMDVTRFKVGDRVYGLVGSGGYAEYCCVNQQLAEHIPAHWDYSLAAALPESLMTVHATVFLLGQLKQEQTLLIHAAGSGITSLAIQMAKLQGAKVFSTASSEEKILKAKKIASISLINYKQEDFESVLGERSVDVIVDFIGGTYFPKHLKLLKTEGKLIQIACMQGYQAEANLLLIMQKRLQINGFVLRPQSLAEKANLWKLAQHQWGTALLNQHIMPVIDSEFAFEDIEQAHLRMQNNEHFGKIVIKVC
ncbi:NAD(P)H-quinone oxidoreductase [Legionella hackeliae]|uniref:Quinone oxidoreductase n=1 Tax=Legionella hackeliae TaxID=449 RepID=A0A0A8UTP2_LEGHA|nr:NAD(P)H-quinone oxidoreductase [Legionella hackeliae]KTD13768.1 quinone oxidoreductase [Legionella hackeliae]CEK10467.1 Quinone oxidoreductase [Legionella hackeliae]STX47203.1 quinone oxidoreductase [Legionella hackeliae]